MTTMMMGLLKSFLGLIILFGCSRSEESATISYVLESFEVEEEKHSNGNGNALAKAKETLPNLDFGRQENEEDKKEENLIVGLTRRTALFGNYSLIMNYVHSDRGDEDRSGGSTFVFLQNLLQGNPRVHNCFGATRFSFWYKYVPHEQPSQQQQQERQGKQDDPQVQFRVLLYDDAQCDSETQDCTRSSNWETWVSTPLPIQLQEQSWHEISISTHMSNWTSNSDQGNGQLDLDRIKGWRIEIHFLSNILEASSPSSSSSLNTFSADPALLFNDTFFFDQVAFQGGSDLFGAIFHVAENSNRASSFQNIVHDKTMMPIYHDSQLSENLTKQQFTSNATFIVNYTIQQRETWGGFIQYQHIPPPRAYYNLSNANAISFDYHVLQPATTPERTHMRLLLLDSSNCLHDCGYSGANLENYYSFHFLLDETTPNNHGTILIPLVGDSQRTTPFWRTGWYGIIGNNALDKEYIKGFKFEFAIDSQGTIGSLSSGIIELAKLNAVSLPSSNQSSITTEDPTDTNDKHSPKCVVEPRLRLLRTASTQFRKIEFLDSNKCCTACQTNPNCVYAMSVGRDCFISDHVYADSIGPLDSDFVQSAKVVFWKDTNETRGDFCLRCVCNSDTRTIDCRGRDLVLVPKIFSFAWSPRILDLRANPRLVVIGSGIFQEIPDLEEIRLPANLSFISSTIMQALPSLRRVLFEQYEETTSALMTSSSSSPQYHPPGNFITGPTQAFADVCCGLGESLPLSPGGSPESQITNLTFCDPQIDKPGADAVYEPFISYANADILVAITPTTPFMFEAAESAAKCAEYCNIRSDCFYFSYDSRSTISEHVCFLLSDLVGAAIRVCCHPEHFSDAEMTKPGWISGRVPRTRHEVDNARVLISTPEEQSDNETLVARESNKYTTAFQVSLGSKPLRGAVWVEPRIASTTIPDLELSFSPPRAVLYDDSTVATIRVTILDAGTLTKDGTVVLTNVVEACDAAFSTSNLCVGVDDLAVSIDVEIPRVFDERKLAAGIATSTIFVLICAIVFLYTDHKRRQADEVWLVKTSELKFADPPEILGRGTFGLVLLAEYRGTQVAVKRVIPPKRKKSRENEKFQPLSDFDSFGSNISLQHSHDVESGLRSKLGSARVSNVSGLFKLHWHDYGNLKSAFIAEMRHLSKLRHPCITTVMGAVISKGEEPMLIMEYMDRGSLYDLLHNETMIIDGEHILPILRDITQGVRFLHAATPQVIHGDLKSPNILVDGRFRAKVSDFGLSQKKRLGATGTPYWMAPELLRGESTYNPKTDIYSFGVVLYEIYSRKDPYDGEEFADVLNQVADPFVNKRPAIPSSCPSEIQTFMRACLEGDPEKRPTFQDLDLQLKALKISNVEPAGAQFGLSKHGTQTERLLHEIFPPHVAQALREGRKVEPEAREMVTIFFSDIVGFTDVSSKLSPMKVADMLDRLYLKFDSLSQKHDVFKVETIGDSWMGVTNLVKDQRDHVKRIADFAVDALDAAQTTWIDMEDRSLGCTNIRIGFHSGPVVANVVGSRNPRYCLFGDTVNTASRMESNSEKGRIQCSEASAVLLKEQHPTRNVRSRGMIDVKGKGPMQTFWVNETGFVLNDSLMTKSTSIRQILS